MTWHTTDDVDEFFATAGDFLRSRPVEHTVPLTVANTIRTRGRNFFGPADPIFGWWQAADGKVDGVLLQSPPHALLLTAVPAEAVPAAAELLADRPLPGVNALASDAEVFAATWRRLTGARTEIGRRSRLYRLDTLVPLAAPPPGRPRVAAAGDRDLLLRWFEAFHDEIGESGRDYAELVDDKLSHQGLTLWELDGRPVSLAGSTRPEAGMVRVVAVYTPRELRGLGYAGAVTSAVTQAALDAGVEDVVLFTDLANKTSNALYQRLGYHPVEDRIVVDFSA
jgi:predicted GNAT family acetyltransferase